MSWSGGWTELSAENRCLWEHQQLLPGGLPGAGLLGTAGAAAGAQEPLQHYGQRSFAQCRPAPRPASFQTHGQLLEQPQPGPGGRAHTPQALHQHLGTLGAKANNEKKGHPDCHAAPGAPLQQESPSPSPKTSRAADLSEPGGADGHCHGGSKGSKRV
ncbi:hypothetical protein P7K49_028000 [Saguinus oedipus]|uniref:Uncharacterized protein n=1 Tax=Saguinus oedipus TaxID=9490 RepID=A0ABQ9UB15_SAGOE|nr:hypothetical protein P7K49_028000 [Saguinus oedipus]